MFIACLKTYTRLKHTSIYALGLAYLGADSMVVIGLNNFNESEGYTNMTQWYRFNIIYRNKSRNLKVYSSFTAWLIRSETIYL